MTEQLCTAGDLLSGVRWHAEDEEAETGHHHTRNDEVEDVVELPALNSHRKSDVNELLRTTVVLDDVSLRRNTCRQYHRHHRRRHHYLHHHHHLCHYNHHHRHRRYYHN